MDGYRGWMNIHYSIGEPLIDITKQHLSSSSKTSTPSNTSLSSNSKHPNSTSKLLQPKVTRAKSKSSSPRPLGPNSKTSSSSSSSCGKHTKRLPKESTSSSKSQTPPPRLKDSKKGPVNFQDLLKIAQKNSKKEESKDISPSVKDGQSDMKGTPAHVGIGKALLDKQRKEEKTAFANKKLDKSDRAEIRQEVRQEISSEKKSHSSYNGRNNDTQQRPKKVEPSTSTSSIKVNPYTNAIINRPQQSSTASSAKIPAVTNTSDEKIKNKPYPYPPIPNRGGMPRPATTRGGMPRPPTARGGMPRPPTARGGMPRPVTGRGSVARPVSARGRGTHSLKSNSFYGTPASARLITDNHSRASSYGAPMSYRSTWVDEMRDYMQHASSYYDDEEEDELDDFVVDDDEYAEEIEGVEDYSSAIRDIFGYDKSRYRLRDEEDDRIMESSFAQQEFEERRR